MRSRVLVRALLTIVCICAGAASGRGQETPPDMYAGIFTLALLGYVLNRLFLMIESRLIRWHTESSGRT